MYDDAITAWDKARAREAREAHNTATARPRGDAVREHRTEITRALATCLACAACGQTERARASLRRLLYLLRLCGVEP